MPIYLQNRKKLRKHPFSSAKKANMAMKKTFHVSTLVSDAIVKNCSDICLNVVKINKTDKKIIIRKDSCRSCET